MEQKSKMAAKAAAAPKAPRIGACIKWGDMFFSSEVMRGECQPKRGLSLIWVKSIAAREKAQT
jgi:hypothetical protein